jgi:hypothetical protein
MKLIRYPILKRGGCMKMFKKLEKIFTAAAFAEAGEFETAREIMREKDSDRKRDTAQKRPRMTAPPANRK